MRHWVSAAVLGLAAAACGGGDAGSRSDLSGSVEIDGSSTVYPITEAVAEEFGLEHGSDVRVTVGFSGTGGGFKRLLRGGDGDQQCIAAHQGQRDRAVPAERHRVHRGPRRHRRSRRRGEPAEPGGAVPERGGAAPHVGAEQPGVAVVADPGGAARGAGQAVRPGHQLGTFDYFTEAIMGEAGAIRTDFSASEDDNVLVQGVAGDRNALGYFGYAYYAENEGRLRAVAVDGGQGCVEPTMETVTSGQYAPLSRPLFIYVSRAALEQPVVAEFVRFYVEHAGALAQEVGYMPLEDSEYQQTLNQLGQGGAS
jgi:phosphate transport system substrate-binding protein